MFTRPLNKDQKYNVRVSMVDGGFFGMGLGFASFVTIIPLFVSTMTGSAILIGLIPAIHTVGWELPQLFSARKLGRLSRYKPYLMAMTLHERLPFLLLAGVALLLPLIGPRVGLVLTFGLLIWQGLGGGFTANPWQSLIGKIIPGQIRGTFLGAQTAASNLLASFAALFAGVALVRLVAPGSYALLFFLAFLAMVVSYFFLGSVREESTPVKNPEIAPMGLGLEVRSILKRDRNFFWYLVARFLSQFALLGLNFYSVYAVSKLGLSVVSVGIMTSVFLAAQIVMNPLMGWLGDHWDHLWVMRLGIVAAIASAAIAWQAHNPSWFYLAYILAGVAAVAMWTIGITLTMEFGSEAERPTYIGMAYTLVVPASAVAPLFGGWLADQYGYPATFLATALFGVMTLLVYLFWVKSPKAIEKIPLIPSLEINPGVDE